jgi:ABC-type sugar transport system substrate-binding protein
LDQGALDKNKPERIWDNDGLSAKGSRRSFLRGGGAATGMLATLLSACNRSSSTLAEKGKSLWGPKRRMVWIPQAAGDWELPIRVGQLEFCKMVGWNYQHLGNPVYSVQNHLDLLNNVVMGRPDVIVTSLESPGVVSGIRSAIKAGITVVLVNQVVPEEAVKLGLHSIVQDEMAAGILNGTQAALWAERISGKKEGIILIGNGNPGSVSIDLRQKGTEQGISSYNSDHGTEFTHEVFADSAFEDIVTSISKYSAQIDEKGDLLAALVGLGGPSGVAIWKTLKQRNIPPGREIAAGSTDVFADQQTAIEEGYLQWGIDQDLLVLGFMSAVSAWLQLEQGYRYWDIRFQGELVLKDDVPHVHARTEAWLSKARQLNLVSG